MNTDLPCLYNIAVRILAKKQMEAELLKQSKGTENETSAEIPNHLLSKALQLIYYGSVSFSEQIPNHKLRYFGNNSKNDLPRRVKIKAEDKIWQATY